MKKTIRKAFPLEISIGILLLIFGLSMFLSGMLFEVPKHKVLEVQNDYLGMFLVATAVVVMVLVLWEELFFPVHVKPEAAELVFRNHRNKLLIQALVYLAIPTIFTYIYLNYAVNDVRFFIWAGICIAAPVGGKLISGINNYNDFLKLTDSIIEYKNNEKVGTFQLSDIQEIVLIRDERNILHKLQLSLADSAPVIIDLDEMELEAFLESIEHYITAHYSKLVKKA